MDKSGKPMLTEEQVKEVVNKYWGIKECLSTQIESYDDQNWKIVVSNNLIPEEKKVFMLKIHHSESSKDALTLIERVTSHLKNNNISTTYSFPSLSNEYIVEWKNDVTSKTHYVRLLYYVPGVMLSTFSPPRKHLYSSLGELVAGVDDTLRSCTPTADELELAQKFQDGNIWVLDNALLIKDKTNAIQGSPIISNPTRMLQIIDNVLDQYTKIAVPLYQDLKDRKERKGLIHNDLNAQNILVDEAGTKIAALIDFGDLHHGFYINNLAIAVAYSLINQNTLGDALTVSDSLLKAYTAKRPLLEIETKALPVLTLTRLIISICMATITCIDQPENIQYVSVDALRAVPKLEQLYNTIYPSNQTIPITDNKAMTYLHNHWFCS